MSAQELQEQMIQRAEQLGIVSRWMAPTIEEIEFMQRMDKQETPAPGTIGYWWYCDKLRELRCNAFQPFYLK